MPGLGLFGNEALQLPESLRSVMGGDDLPASGSPQGVCGGRADWH